MGAPLKVTLDKAGCATAWKEKASKHWFLLQSEMVESPLSSKVSKNAFRPLASLGCCLESKAELDCVRPALSSRQVLFRALWASAALFKALTIYICPAPSLQSWRGSEDATEVQAVKSGLADSQFLCDAVFPGRFYWGVWQSSPSWTMSFKNIGIYYNK